MKRKPPTAEVHRQERTEGPGKRASHYPVSPERGKGEEMNTDCGGIAKRKEQPEGGKNAWSTMEEGQGWGRL